MALRCILIVWLLLVSILPAQYTTASLGGNIQDISGAPVAATKVSIRNTETGFTLATESGDDGAFLFPRLPVGVYELSADKPGFSSYVQTGITLTVNQLASQNITLKVGQVSERITVEANADLVDTRSGTVDQLVDQEKIVELPLNGQTRPEIGVSSLPARWILAVMAAESAGTAVSIRTNRQPV